MIKEIEVLQNGMLFDPSAMNTQKLVKCTNSSKFKQFSGLHTSSRDINDSLVIGTFPEKHGISITKIYVPKHRFVVTL